jgi:hypothetical protein
VITVGFLEQLKTSREHQPSVPAGTAAGDKPFREIESPNGLLTRGPWRDSSTNVQAFAVEISYDICPHCGHRLSLDGIEPAGRV